MAQPQLRAEPDDGDPVDDAPEIPAHSPFRASRRHDGWSGERQAAFLEHVADGVAVETACRMVGLSTASAYAFRRTAKGAAFDLGWRAANIVAREHVADTLMLRAMQGQTVTVTRDDGSTIERHQYDNRLALALLARLDRQADDATAGDARAARLVAGEFDAFVALIEREGAAPARAGLFLARRMPSGAADARDLAPVLALAAADRFARCGTAIADEVATGDLDPARRDDWTAEQWRRADAAGLLALAGTATGPQHSQHSQLAAEGPAPVDAPERVWWDEDRECWLTDFPPPADYLGMEDGDYGDDDYQRELDDDEAELADGPRAATIERRRAEDTVERDAWFGARQLEAEARAAEPAQQLALAPPAEERH